MRPPVAARSFILWTFVKTTLAQSNLKFNLHKFLVLIKYFVVIIFIWWFILYFLILNLIELKLLELKKEEIQTEKPIFSLNKASYCLFNKVKPFHNWVFVLIDLVTLLRATVSLNINPMERGSKCSTTPPPKINTPRVSEADLITPTKTLSLFTLNGFSARPEHVGRPAP